MLEDVTGVPFTQSKGVSDSYRWLAPELCIDPGILSMYSDVFAYGMTVVEVSKSNPDGRHDLTQRHRFILANLHFSISNETLRY